LLDLSVSVWLAEGRIVKPQTGTLAYKHWLLGISSPIEKSRPNLSKLIFQGEYPGCNLGLVSPGFVFSRQEKAKGQDPVRKMDNGSPEVLK
jgi:hypothetical protein